MKTKLTDTPYYSKNLDFNHRDVVDDTAIFTAHAPFCCCSRVVSGFLESRCVRLRVCIFSFT